jgi:hypothetical protein
MRSFVIYNLHFMTDGKGMQNLLNHLKEKNNSGDTDAYERIILI